MKFTASDCEPFNRNKSGAPWNDASPGDQDRFKDIRLRLKTLAQHLAPIATKLGISVSSAASQTAPNGRVPREMWSCVFPDSVANKSFALQFAVIINGAGSEVCCCLGAGTSQETDSATLSRLEQAWRSLTTALGSIPAEVQQTLEGQLGDRWQLRRSWLEEPGQSDFSSLKDWLRYASADNGAGASISRNLTPEEVQAEGDHFVDRLAADFEMFAPLFRHIYGGHAPVSERVQKVVPPPSAIHPKLWEELTALHTQLTTRGDLHSLEALQGFYATFRIRFGPDILAATDGEALLSLMHETNRDGLVYWLEFKDDDEFPAVFGSIAGGSALKFGLYRRRETGAWTTGSPSAQRELSLADAIQMARGHRDQLIAADQVLSRFPVDSDDAAYSVLQQNLARVAPTVQDSAWGHKYLSLLHPDKLDDYHAPAYQRFHLIKLLQQPPDADGRYVCAGRFMRLRRLFGWPVNQLGTVLNRRNGPPHRYWRIGTTDERNQSYWQAMRDQSVVRIGWRNVGDLSGALADDDFKEAVRHRVAEHYPATPQAVGRATQQITRFCQSIQERDYVVACDGASVLGIGRVTGPYQFDANGGFPHQRPVEWLDIGEWQLPTTEGLRTTVHECKNHPDNLVALEKRVLDGSATAPSPRAPVVTSGATTPSGVWSAGGTVAQIQDVLNRKSQVILYGPPGTGKTYWAERAAANLAALWNFGASFDHLDDAHQKQVVGPGADALVQFCCFHPGYGYEDFIEGYRPGLVDGALHFERHDGLFKRLCDTAAQHPNARYYLIVDEINRGDIPRIFGELLSLLDKPKRGTTALLPLSGHALTVPTNLFLIGTMNTADRSIALLDTALRRRFGFIELLPDATVLGGVVVEGIALGPWLAAINRQITTHIGRDGRSLQIGHSYFLAGGRPLHDLGQLSRVLQEDILPLLEEYCYDEWESLERILGQGGLVDMANRRFKTELFEPHRRDDLVRAILAVAPDVSTSAIAVAADAGESAPDTDSDEDQAD